MFTNIITKEMIDSFVNKNDISILYFSGDTCGVCSVLKSKISSVISKYKNIELLEIEVQKNLELSSAYDVFSIPVILVYAKGKESFRYGRNIDMLEFEKMIDRFSNLLK